MSEVKLKWRDSIDRLLGDVYRADRTAGGEWDIILSLSYPPLFSVAVVENGERKQHPRFPTFLEADAYCAAENEKAEEKMVQAASPVKEPGEAFKEGQWWGNVENPIKAGGWAYIESVGSDYLYYTDAANNNERITREIWNKWVKDEGAVDVTALVRAGLAAEEWRDRCEKAENRADEFAKLCDGMAPLSGRLQERVESWLTLANHGIPLYAMKWGRFPNALILELFKYSDDIAEVREKLKEERETTKDIHERVSGLQEKVKRLRERAIKAEVTLRAVRKEAANYLSNVATTEADADLEKEIPSVTEGDTVG